MHFTDIVDTNSMILIVLFGTAVLFKEHLVESKATISFDTDVSFERHEEFIESLNLKRWGNVYGLTLFVMSMRIADMASWINFSVSAAMILLMFGIIFVFRKELYEYIDYFKGRKTVKTVEEVELEIISSLYASRTIFLIIISAFVIMAGMSFSMLNIAEAFFAFMFVIGMSLYIYRYSLDEDIDTIYQNIKNTQYNNYRSATCSLA